MILFSKEDLFLYVKGEGVKFIPTKPFTNRVSLEIQMILNCILRPVRLFSRIVSDNKLVMDTFDEMK